MITLVLILKWITLAMAIIYTFSNTFKAFRGLGINDIQLWIMGLSISSYVTLISRFGFYV